MSARLSDYGDTVGIKDICAVLGISSRELRRLRAHGAFVEPIPHLPRRWKTENVQRFIDGQARRTLRRVG